MMPAEVPFPFPVHDDDWWMGRALVQARAAALRGEVPVGAVLVGAEGMLAEAGNGPIGRQDPTAHAEILVLRAGASTRGNYRLSGTTLYVTLEPCLMCMGALLHARVDRLVYGAVDPKSGAADSLYSIGRDCRLNHSLTVSGGVLAAECAELLRTFFQNRRKPRISAE
jgi:tRNA(adenine34) deaminase